MDTNMRRIHAAEKAQKKEELAAKKRRRAKSGGVACTARPHMRARTQSEHTCVRICFM